MPIDQDVMTLDDHAVDDGTTQTVFIAPSGWACPFDERLLGLTECRASPSFGFEPSRAGQRRHPALYETMPRHPRESVAGGRTHRRPVEEWRRPRPALGSWDSRWRECLPESALAALRRQTLVQTPRALERQHTLAIPASGASASPTRASTASTSGALPRVRR